MKYLLVLTILLAGCSSDLFCNETSDCPAAFYCDPGEGVCTPIEDGTDSGSDTGSDSGTDSTIVVTDAGTDSMIPADSTISTDSTVAVTDANVTDSSLSDSSLPATDALPGDPDPGCHVNVPSPGCPECFNQDAAACVCVSNGWCCNPMSVTWDSTCVGTYSLCRNSEGEGLCPPP